MQCVLNNSEVERFSVGNGSVSIDLCLKSTDVLGLGVSTHDTDLVNFEERLEQISSTNIEKMFNLIIARVLPESLIVKICLIQLNWRAFITLHELLEVQEAQIPRITFLICKET